MARLIEQADPARPTEGGRAHCTYRWIVEDGRVLGGMALRHKLNGVAWQLGHLGYGIRPSARGRGLAGWALGRMLDEARTLGLDRVLVVCAVDNLASAKTIERAGGELEAIEDAGLGPTRRYWITLSPAPTRR
ncbi:GNAT family N-acetyltransferase [Plantactinospora siamensis]|uniref:GNAT family N-acetyltransferase n=1 Tax=Plantactinospora siamensis TaxID=555372 RepID=A0ABV6NX08_9ACTN